MKLSHAKRGFFFAFPYQIYLCAKDSLMPKLLNMEDYLDQLENILDRAEQDREEHVRIMSEQRDYHERQLTVYKDMIDNGISFHRERIDQAEKRLSRFMNISIVLFTVFIGFIVGGFTTHEARISKIEGNERLADPVQKREVINGFDEIIDSNIEVFYKLGLQSEDVSKYDNTVRNGVTRAMGDISRGIESE